MSRLSHHVNNDPNGIMQLLGPGQTNHKFHINILPLRCWDVNRLVKTSWLKVFDLNVLAIGALLHKLRNILLHSFPLINILEIMIHLDGT